MIFSPWDPSSKLAVTPQAIIFSSLSSTAIILIVEHLYNFLLLYIFAIAELKGEKKKNGKDWAGFRFQTRRLMICHWKSFPEWIRALFYPLPPPTLFFKIHISYLYFNDYALKTISRLADITDNEEIASYYKNE